MCIDAISVIAQAVLTDDELDSFNQFESAIQRKVLLSTVLRAEETPAFVWRPLPGSMARMLAGEDVRDKDQNAEISVNVKYLDLDPSELTQSYQVKSRELLSPNGVEGFAILWKLYESIAMGVEQVDRGALLERLTDMSMSGMTTAFAQIPPLLLDSDHNIVSMAAINLLMLLPTQPSSEEHGLDLLLDLATRFEDSETPTTGGILAGLLLTGDRRVIERVEAALDDCEHDVEWFLGAARSPLASAARAEFLLTHCEMASDVHLGTFGSYAKGLEEMALQAQDKMVVEIVRDFPVSGPDDLGVRVVEAWPVPEFGKKMEERLLPSDN